MINANLKESTREPHILNYKIFQSSDRECLFVGAKHWDVSKSKHYKQVCTVDWFGGMQMEGHDWYVEDMEEVFRILNGYYIDEETGHDDVFDVHVSGYRIVEGVRKDGTEYKFRDMHSLSVGDIIVDDSPDGDSKAYIVDSFGFKQIQFDYTLEERFCNAIEIPGAKKAAPCQQQLDLEVA